MIVVGITSCENAIKYTDKDTKLSSVVVDKLQEIKSDTIPDTYQNTTIEDNHNLYIIENGKVTKYVAKEIMVIVYISFGVIGMLLIIAFTEILVN